MSSAALDPRPRQAATTISVKAIGRFPVASAIIRSSSSACADSVTLAGEHADPGDHVQRELELHERAAVTRELLVAGAQRTPGIGVPQLLGDRDGVAGDGEPQPVPVVVRRRVGGEHQLARPAQ